VIIAAAAALQADRLRLRAMLSGFFRADLRGIRHVA
jgi:hypothetical protein